MQYSLIDKLVYEISSLLVTKCRVIYMRKKIQNYSYRCKMETIAFNTEVRDLRFIDKSLKTFDHSL